MIGTYAIENTETGEKYVGSSRDIEKRFISHKSQLKKGKHHCQPLQDAYQTFGLQFFSFIVLEECEESELEAKETELLQQDNLYNVFKQAYRVFGKNHPMFGRTHSEEARAKIKAARAKQVIKHSAETRAKIGAGNKGRVMPPGHMEKLLKSREGLIPWNKGVKTGVAPPNKIHLSDFIKKEIGDKYQSGRSVESLRKEYTLSWDTIHVMLKSEGILTRTISQQKTIYDTNRKNSK